MPLTPTDLASISQGTLAHYEESAESFREGTQHHDVTQNYAALLSRLEGPGSKKILDLGCGPGRDLAHFKALGHQAVGVDGCETFCQMARAATGCAVLHQDFMKLSLPARSFDGVFANASLFHVPSQELRRVLGDLHAALELGGVLFCSNPRGDNREGWWSGRYGVFYDLPTWRAHVEAAGFTELDHYYRPQGKPLAEQPWLATVWRAVEVLG